MNPEQAKSSVRWMVTTFGAGIAGFVAGKGWASADTILQVLNSPAFLSAGASLVMLIWGLVTHTDKNTVAMVAAMAEDPLSPVKGVITTNDMAGRELAQAIPSPTVVPEGTSQAVKIAKSTTQL